MNVHRLAAVDMYGERGTLRRRRIILTEFVVGAIGMVSFGVWLLTSSPDLGGTLLALWLIGAGLNYWPLAVHAGLLSRPGALEMELSGVDTAKELRRYGVLQLWILVPLALVVLACRDTVRDH